MAASLTSAKTKLKDGKKDLSEWIILFWRTQLNVVLNNYTKNPHLATEVNIVFSVGTSSVCNFYGKLLNV